MTRLTVKHLRFIVISGILLAGCQGITQIAQGLADSAPPAKPPQIVGAINLYKWNGTTDFFLISPTSTFEIDVSRGFSNRLILMEDGVVVPEFDGNNPNNGARTVQIINDTSHDTNAKTTQSRVKIFPPQGGYAEGRVVQFLLVEESINPKYTGQQARDSKPFTTMVPAPPPGITDYMGRCYKSGVPLPPDWAETGTPWVLQGNLKTGPRPGRCAPGPK